MMAANISTIFLVIAITKIFLVIATTVRFEIPEDLLGVFSDCLVPAPPENGYLKYEPSGAIYLKDYNFSDFNTIEENECVYFYCDERYKIEGEYQICCAKGTMQDEAPSCVKKYCYDRPPSIENGRYLSQRRIFKNGMKVFAKCADGYRLKRGSSEFVQCERRGNELSWSTDIPICEEIRNCGDPGTPINGARIGDDFQAGETVSFTCDEGDELIGSETLTCGYDGVWDAERPRCRPPVFCPDPPVRDHVKYRRIKPTKDYFIAGDEVEVVCDEGYAIQEGTDRLSCILDEYDDFSFLGDDNVPFWSDDFPSCEEIFCSEPPIPRHGLIRHVSKPSLRGNDSDDENIFRYGYGVVYSCDKGYQLVGAHFSECTESGWKPSKRYCKKIQCGDPPTPEDGWKRGQGENIGDVLKFGCNVGYQISGSEERECLENGRWSGEPAICVTESTHCPNPGIPEHGLKSGQNYNLGDKVSFMCDAGYTLIGSRTRECAFDRVWTGEDVICKKSTDFDRTNELEYRFLANLDSILVAEDSLIQPTGLNTPVEIHKLPSGRNPIAGDQLDVKPEAGGTLILYFIFDSSRSVGKINFNMSIDFVKALVKRIGVSEKGVRVGAAAFGNEVNKKRNFLPTESIDTEDVLKKLEDLKLGFTGGGSNIFKALEHVNLDVMGAVERIIKRKITTRVFLFSKGVFNLGGDSTILATKMKDRGVRFSCVAVSGGKVNTEVLYDIASERTNVYTLKDNEQIKWMVDQVLNDKVDYSRCGLRVNELINEGRAMGNVTKTYWPWMAMIRQWEKNERKFRLFCGGSIIHRNWILTAAQCVFKDNGKRNAEDIMIRLGYTKENNESFVQDLEADKIFIHPEFHKLVRFDYDVALIKLKRSADYQSKRVRPICLSPPEKNIPDKSTLYSEKSEGWAIGYGKFPNEKVDRRRSFRDLREVTLDTGRHGDCEKGLLGSQIKNYTSRMFCAGGLKDLDTCDGDGGGPFMKHQYNAVGESYWVQTGITSFNPWNRCGVEGEYGYYTKVSVVREWIDKTIRNN